MLVGVLVRVCVRIPLLRSLLIDLHTLVCAVLVCDAQKHFHLLLEGLSIHILVVSATRNNDHVPLFVFVFAALLIAVLMIVQVAGSSGILVVVLIVLLCVVVLMLLRLFFLVAMVAVVDGLVFGVLELHLAAFELAGVSEHV